MHIVHGYIRIIGGFGIFLLSVLITELINVEIFPQYHAYIAKYGKFSSFNDIVGSVKEG